MILIFYHFSVIATLIFFFLKRNQLKKGMKQTDVWIRDYNLSVCNDLFKFDNKVSVNIT